MIHLSYSLLLPVLLVHISVQAVEPFFAERQPLPITQADSVKKHTINPRASTVKPTKQTTPTQYSAPGHYTVTVPAINGAGGKADLILVNGTKQVERIGDVDANTIESIEVFKDTKTIAKYKVQYGDIANKGVVLIHLKNKTL